MSFRLACLAVLFLPTMACVAAAGDPSDTAEDGLEHTAVVRDLSAGLIDGVGNSAPIGRLGLAGSGLTNGTVGTGPVNGTIGSGTIGTGPVNGTIGGSIGADPVNGTIGEGAQ